MNIFERIRADHDKQRTLIDLLTKTHGDSRGRQELFERLKAELEEHAMAEERHFYVPLMEKDLTQEKARHSVAEHHELDELIKKLEETPYDSPGWLPTAKKLCDELLHHLDEEENEVFQLAGKALEDDEKQSLADDFDQHRKSLKQHA
ncbi:DNA nickase [Posidoniimonas corsicana]|uniref:DNA nickase n=1 Tax=Posidoniimonas corsicana TaxID=1938618 RepID=A0A5C5V3H5_9BACT|nr:hemerythrin domain-containing protein [Posidoniimonas corsicana]TWT32503.1 DNA nickase [Posidoniimonas corsicana]